MTNKTAIEALAYKCGAICHHCDGFQNYTFDNEQLLKFASALTPEQQPTSRMTEGEIEAIWEKLYPITSNNLWVDWRNGIYLTKFARAIEAHLSQAVVQEPVGYVHHASLEPDPEGNYEHVFYHPQRISAGAPVFIAAPSQAESVEARAINQKELDAECNVCGGRLINCQRMGHRPESDRHIKWKSSAGSLGENEVTEAFDAAHTRAFGGLALVQSDGGKTVTVPAELYQAWSGLVFGCDWNSGTHAKKYRSTIERLMHEAHTHPTPAPLHGDGESLPELPESSANSWHPFKYTTEQMQAYARQALAHGRQEAQCPECSGNGTDEEGTRCPTCTSVPPSVEALTKEVERLERALLSSEIISEVNVEHVQAKLAASEALAESRLRQLVADRLQYLDLKQSKVPDGYVLVPIEPTEEMISAVIAENLRWPLGPSCYDTWQAMLKAALQSAPSSGDMSGEGNKQ